MFSKELVPEWRVNHEFVDWRVWLLFTVPLSFIVIGAGGLIYAAMPGGGRRSDAPRWPPYRGSGAASRRKKRRPPYPFVPGRRYDQQPRHPVEVPLPMANSPGWALAGTLAFCVGWNGAVVLAAILIGGHLNERPGWLATLLCVPFVLIGLGSIAVFLRQLLKTAGIGPTLVEISDHPIDPGRRYRAVVSQSGRLKVKSLRVSLACVETATYRQGTNTRTESQEVYRQELFRREKISDSKAACRLKATSNWTSPGTPCTRSRQPQRNRLDFMVEGEPAGWSDYQRAFPVIVRPNMGDFSA